MLWLLLFQIHWSPCIMRIPDYTMVLIQGNFNVFSSLGLYLESLCFAKIFFLVYLFILRLSNLDIFI